MAAQPDVEHASARPHEPDWVQHAIWWHVYPLGAVGAPIRPEGDEAHAVVHRLDRIEAWLDHLVALGANGLLLGPVFAASTHGYDTVDHRRVDPRLGDDADLDRLLAAARERGIRVLLDGVFHHVGREHPAFAALAEQGPDAPTAELFRVRWEGWQPGDPIDADVFEGHEALVALDHGSRAVEDLVVDVMTHWLGRGIDGWRLDAAYAIDPSFWARVLPRVREAFPEAWWSGEVIHGDQAAIVAASTMDSVTQYELWQGIWHGIADENLHELAHAIGRHDDMLGSFVPTTFVGNHDVTRIATAVGAERVPHALAVLLTVGGTPTLYAGDELAEQGEKEERIGGDDAVRPELAAAPPRDDELESAAAAALAATRALVAVRRRHPWLRTARTDVVEVTNHRIHLRTAVGDAAIRTLVSIDDEPWTVEVDGGLEHLAGDGEVEGSRVRLAPHGWAVAAEA